MRSSLPRLALAGLLLSVAAAGCAPRGARTARDARPAASEAAPKLEHVSDSEEWFPFEQIVAGLLLDEAFGTLDSIAAGFGPATPLFLDGSSRERHFYMALAGENFRVSKGQRARFLGCLKRWRVARPDSRVAVSAYAYTMAKLAWDERGADVAARTNDRQLSRFEADLDAAWAALAPQAGERGRNGGWYMAALRIGLGQGWERGRMMQLRNDCLRDAPWIENAEGMVARALLPRWGGAPGEWEAFAASVAATSPDGRGPQRYAWIVTSLQEVHANLFRETDASWPVAHAGFEALESEHPLSVTLPSRDARFAWMAGDREAAKAEFARLDDRVDLNVWRSDEEFLEARAWADEPPS